MRLNPKKTKFMVVSRSWISASGYGELILSSAELEEVKSLRILGITFVSKSTFVTHLREVVSKAARYLGVIRRSGKLFDCPHVLKGGFNHIFYPAWSIVLRVLDSIVRSAERVCVGELCCLGHRRKVSAVGLLYKIYHRVDHPMTQYLKHYVAARNTKASAARSELAVLIPRCRTDQFSRSFLHADERL